MKVVSGTPTKKAEMQIFSHRLSTVMESREIPGSQVSYILVYGSSVLAFKYRFIVLLCLKPCISVFVCLLLFYVLAS